MTMEELVTLRNAKEKHNHDGFVILQTIINDKRLAALEKYIFHHYRNIQDEFKI